MSYLPYQSSGPPALRPPPPPPGVSAPRPPPSRARARSKSPAPPKKRIGTYQQRISRADRVLHLAAGGGGPRGTSSSSRAAARLQVRAEDRADRAAARKVQQSQRPQQQPTQSQQQSQPTQQPRQSSRLDNGLAAARGALNSLIDAFRKSTAASPAAPTGSNAAIGDLRSGVNQQAVEGKKAVKERSKKGGRASTILTSGTGLGLSSSPSSTRKTLLGA